ncbi:MAG: hypothetical protein K0R25_529 [Rickettsiaceae bacterium]|jgi:hypothetical protein|nr:hypothetical protein [Rickettsiaceae bacterium]
MSDGSFAEKYAKKGGNTISKLLEEKKSAPERKTTGEALGHSSSAETRNSPIDATKSSKADLVYLVKGVDDGRNAWYYVLVERLKLSLFLKALNDDIIHLENYGEILYSAYGDEPPQNITDELKREYDIK